MEDPEDLTEAKLADFERFFAPLAPILEGFADCDITSASRNIIAPRLDGALFSVWPRRALGGAFRFSGLATTRCS